MKIKKILPVFAILFSLICINTVKAASVVFSWQNPTDYEYWAKTVIYRSTIGFQGTSGVKLVETTASTFTDTDVTPGQTYYYSFYAVDDLGNYSDPENVLFNAPLRDDSGDDNDDDDNDTNANTNTNTIPGSGGSRIQRIPTILLNIPYGSSGDGVKNLQNYLIYYGFLAPGYNTGYYGDLTRAAVARYNSTPTLSTVSAPTAIVNTSPRDIPLALLSISPGTQSESVRALQSYLIAYGYLAPGLSTGFYGELTRQAVAKYNNSGSGSIPTVVATPTTVASGSFRIPGSFRFQSTWKAGVTNEDIRKLQIMLNDLGFTVSGSGPGSRGSETSYFGPATSNALIRFQEQYRADILDTNSWERGNLGLATMIKLNEVIGIKTKGQ